MRKSFIEKSNNGNYSFTSFGLYSVHVLAIKKLVSIYLRDCVKLNDVKIKEQLKGIDEFISVNFTEIRDFLSKISNVSSMYLKEANSQDFIQFTSRVFVGTLEEVKKKVFDKELLLLHEEEKRALLTSGEQILKELGEFFLAAEPLRWKEHLLNKEAEKQKKEGRIVSVDDEELKRPLGEKFLDDLGLLFCSSCGMYEKFKVHAQLNDSASFITFISLERYIRAYRTKKDVQGYKLWMSKLSKYEIATVIILSELRKEQKGISILWGDFFSKLSLKVGFESSLLFEFKINLQIYLSLLNYMKTVFVFVKSLVSDKALLQQLYQDITKLSNDSMDISSKKQTMEFSLLPITDEYVRKKVYTRISSFLDKLSKFYV